MQQRNGYALTKPLLSKQWQPSTSPKSELTSQCLRYRTPTPEKAIA
ncbi:MAG: hypothetical protein ACLBM4_23675 [Dolichospermum sp.]